MMSDWSAVSVSGGWEDGGDADSRLLAENAELAGRLRLLGPALASLTHDLARVRRENAAASAGYDARESCGRSGKARRRQGHAGGSREGLRVMSHAGRTPAIVDYLRDVRAGW